MEILKKISIIAACTFLFSAAMAQSNSVAEAAFSKSYVAEQAGNYTAAINEVKAVYKAENYIDNLRLGWLNYLAKQYTLSVSFYEKAIALNPYAIEARFGCVKPLSALENWEKVKENYQEILKIDGQNTTANYWLGVIYYHRKDYSSAGKLFEKNVNLYPVDYDSVIMLAWCKLNLGKHEDAKVLFNQALIIRPKDTSATSGLKLIK
jgi:tetratricopeptide (TPR) repeat protein